MILGICVGIFAGFLAGRIMSGSGYGIFMDLLLGVAGAIVGSVTLGMIGLRATGLIGGILVSTFGAVLLIWLSRWFRSRRPI